MGQVHSLVDMYCAKTGSMGGCSLESHVQQDITMISEKLMGHLQAGQEQQKALLVELS